MANPSVVRKIGAGVVSGLVGGLVLDAVMRAMSVHGPGGGSMVAYLGDVIRPADPWLGWVAYLVYGAVLGGAFAYVVHDRTPALRDGVLWGVVYGIGWWVATCAIFLPALWRTMPFGEEARQELRQVALPLLLGHVVYGGVLGAVFGWVMRAFDGARWHPARHAHR